MRTHRFRLFGSLLLGGLILIANAYFLMASKTCPIVDFTHSLG